MTSQTSSWRTIFTVVALAALAYGLVVLVADLGTRLRAPSFSILRVQNGWQSALLYLLGAVGLLALTSLAGKLVGERARGRPVAYRAVLGDQLTHLFIWIVIVLALYPLLQVVAASFDPTNNLFSFAQVRSDNILLRSKVIPAFARADLSNYARLFEGVVIYSWQWALVVVGLLSLLSLGATSLVNRMTNAGGRPTRGLAQTRVWASRLLILSILLFFAFLGKGQFTGSSNESKFLLWIRNTFLISSITGAVAVLLTTTAGYAIARLRFPGRFQALMFFIFVQMFPGFLGLVAIFFLIYSLGLLNTFTGLILAYSGGAIAFGTWIYKGYVESLPASLEEAALVDGATRWSAFYKIVLPLSGPMLVFIFLLQFIGTYAEFILANIILTGAENWNVGVGLRSFTAGQFSTRWGVFAAASVLGSLPIVALFYGFQQVFVSGTLSGGVKE